jgi:hypothetical protein
MQFYTQKAKVYSSTLKKVLKADPQGSQCNEARKAKLFVQKDSVTV